MTASIHDFRPAAPASGAAGVHTAGPLKGLPVRGPRRPALHLVEPAAEADETILAVQLLTACAPPRFDRLEAAPAVKMRQGAPVQAIVIVEADHLHLIASADVMRRMAVVVDGAGRTGAALDLMQAADQAEALAGALQRGAH